MIRMTLAPSRLTLILLMLLALGPGLTDARGQPKACGSEIRSIEVNQTTLRYYECGQGEPLIFVHGAFGDLQTFRQQVEAFATSFRVIVYSRRFFRPNAPPREPDRNPLSTHVADLRALITELKATPAHLVGSSYGAYISLALAVDHPELVRSLVLGEPPIWSLLSGTSVAESMRQSLTARAEATRKAFESGNLEDGFRTFVDTICQTGKCFDSLPEAQRKELVKVASADSAIGVHDRPVHSPASSRLREAGQVDQADALGDGRAKCSDVPARDGRTRTLPGG